MADPYPVVTIQPAWMLAEEGMGTKRKFWYRDPSTKVEWLFKYPREGTGEHWAEKIAAEVAGLLGVDHAQAELAVYREQKGVAVKSFVPSGLELVHGNQLMEIAVESYNRRAGFRYKRHTLANIWDCLGLVGRLTGSDLETTKSRFAEYLLLDAIVGNTDRHHENWGIILGLGLGAGMVQLAPSFDHGSSLGRELRDRRRGTRLEGDQVGAYVLRGRGGVYWSEEETRGPSPLDLFRRSARLYPKLFLPALSRIERLSDRAVRELVDRVPQDWMSAPEREFAYRLMQHSIEELRRIGA